GGARDARAHGLAAAVPRPGPRDPDHRRGHRRAARDPAPGRRRVAGGGAPGGALRRAVAVVRGAAGGALGRCAGRRAHLRLPDRDPRGDERRRDDRRLGTPSVRPRGDDLGPDRERDPGRQPRGARRDVEAARDHRVGVADRLVGRLASARIGETYNQYAASPLLRDRLRAYLEANADARIVLVGEAAAPFLHEVLLGRSTIAVGRLAAAATSAPYVRHPAHGGAAEFEAGLQRAFATIGRRRAPVRPFL